MSLRPRLRRPLNVVVPFFIGKPERTSPPEQRLSWAGNACWTHTRPCRGLDSNPSGPVPAAVD